MISLLNGAIGFCDEIELFGNDAKPPKVFLKGHEFTFDNMVDLKGKTIGVRRG